MKKHILCTVLLFISIGCTNNSGDDFAGVLLNSSASDLKSQGFTCKTISDGITCIRFDKNPTIINEDIKEIAVSFDKTEIISGISVTLVKEPASLEDVFEIQHRLDAIYEERESKMNGSSSMGYIRHWNRNDKSVVRLVVLNGIQGLIKQSISLVLFPKNMVTGDI